MFNIISSTSHQSGQTSWSKTRWSNVSSTSPTCLTLPELGAVTCVTTGVLSDKLEQRIVWPGQLEQGIVWPGQLEQGIVWTVQLKQVFIGFLFFIEIVKCAICCAHFCFSPFIFLKVYSWFFFSLMKLQGVHFGVHILVSLVWYFKIFAHVFFCL